MELTLKLKKRFIKDYSLPIPVLDSPYFGYYIDTYDELFHCKSKLESFKMLIKEFSSEEDVFNYLTTNTNTIINDIIQKDSYKQFLKADMNKFAVTSKYPSSSIFKMHNAGKQLISIDLTKANFQSLNYFDKNILDAKTYDDFIKRYNKNEYIVTSKHIRQIIFGNLNSKRQQTIERYMIQQVLDKLLINMHEDCIVLSVTSDEIVLEGDMDTYLKVVDILKNNDIKVAIELFTLKALRKKDGQLYKKDSFFVKEFNEFTDNKNVNFEIKATDASSYAQFYKLYTKKPINVNDLIFVNEGRIAFYKDAINGEIY